MERRSPADILSAAAHTFRERNAVYRDNLDLVGDTLEALFPEGLSVKTSQEWSRLHLLVLIVVKLTRYARCYEKGGHQDSLRDMAVYSAILEAVDGALYGGKDERSSGSGGAAGDGDGGTGGVGSHPPAPLVRG